MESIDPVGRIDKYKAVDYVDGSSLGMLMSLM